MPKQKYQKIITALLLCLSILLIVAGCSSDSAQKSNSTAAYTVTDSQGHKLYFKEKPQRIISMSISTDEILMTLYQAVALLPSHVWWTTRGYPIL